jgi:hypothetical protein
MSQGLGKVEAFVLEALNRYRPPVGWTGSALEVTRIAYQFVNGFDSALVIRPSASVYQSVCRAVRSLERKGLVESVKRGQLVDGYKRIYKPRECHD